MENSNENANVQSNDLSDWKKQLEDYKAKQAGKKPKSSEDMLSKYFVPRNTKEVFRILPPKPGKKHIEEAFFHVVVTNAKGGQKKKGTIVYCPAHNDPKVAKLDVNGNVLLDGNGKPIMVPAPCPLCAKHKALISKQNPSIKFKKKENMTEAELVINEKNKKIFKEASEWEAKKFYIIRGIDQGNTKHGVKIWRFKHNFKNQGTLDKLLPILDDFTTNSKVNFADVQKGTDLTITMADSELILDGKKTIYKAISAITAKGSSPLNNDPIVVEQWISDPITWRDVFKPKTAPVITPLQFLEMIVDGTNPYWDDTDTNNKHWVFPGNPELEKQANTRKQKLDEDENENFEQASDLDYSSQPQSSVTISNIKPTDIGVSKETAVDITAKPLEAEEEYSEDNSEATTDYEDSDLPF